MKHFFKVSILLVVGIMLSQFAYAETVGTIYTQTVDDAPFTIGEAVLNGNGCPDGTATTVLSPDGTELSIMFSDFTAETGSRPYDYANCNVAIPINLPPGVMVGLVGIDYRGLAMIPSGGMGRLSREYFFAGERGPRLTDDIQEKNQFSEFLYEDELDVVTWTSCGESTIARSNATIMVMAPQNSFMPAMMSVFSEDYDVSIQYHLVWDHCK